MDYYVYNLTDDKDFVSFLSLARYIQENRDEIVWKGGFYPRKKDTNYRGAKAFEEILKDIEFKDFKFAVKCLKLLRHEYFCDVEHIKTEKKEIAESLFEDSDNVYVGTEAKEIEVSHYEDLINIINETEMDKKEWKDVIQHILLKL